MSSGPRDRELWWKVRKRVRLRGMCEAKVRQDGKRPSRVAMRGKGG